MSSTSPSSLLNFPVPNIKSVIMATLRPELRAIADVYEDVLNDIRAEVAQLHDTIDQFQAIINSHGTTVTNCVNRVNSVETQVSSMDNSKADKSVVNVLSSRMDSAEDVLDSHDTSIGGLTEMLTGMDGSNVGAVLDRLDIMQAQIETLNSSNDQVTVRVEDVYQLLLMEIQELRNLVS